MKRCAHWLNILRKWLHRRIRDSWLPNMPQWHRKSAHFSGTVWCLCGGIKCCATTRLSVTTTPPTQVGWSTSRSIDAVELFSNNYTYVFGGWGWLIKRAWQQMTNMLIMEMCLCSGTLLPFWYVLSRVSRGPSKIFREWNMSFVWIPAS